jgi:hypothetical protein
VALYTRTTKASTAGRHQRQQKAAARVPDLRRFYGRSLPAVTPGEFEFRLDLLRPGADPLALDAHLVAFEWMDEEAALTGNLQLRRPGDSWASLPIGRGHLVRCRVRWAGRWYELWTMRCDIPTTTVEDRSITVDVKDDMALIRSTERHYRYRATKRQPHGQFGHDILRDAAKRDGIRLGALVECTQRLKKVEVRGSFIDLATHVYSEEKTHTGQSFVMRMRDGRFEVVHYRRNRVLFVLGDEMRALSVTPQPKVDNPATVITGVGRVGHGKGAKTVRHTEYRRAIVDRFGYSRKTRNFGHVGSAAELREKVQAALAKQLAVDRTATVQVQGLPFVRRGDGLLLDAPEERFAGEDAFVFATAVRHQVEGGSYTTEVDVTSDDPFVKAARAREAAARARKAAARKRAA